MGTGLKKESSIYVFRGRDNEAGTERGKPFINGLGVLCPNRCWSWHKVSYRDQVLQVVHSTIQQKLEYRVGSDIGFMCCADLLLQCPSI